MKRYEFLVLLLLIVVIESCFQSKWIEYQNDELNFKVEFIEEPKINIEDVFFNEATLKNYTFEVSIDDASHENKYYSLTVTSYPASYIHSDSALVLIEEFINSTQYELLDIEDYTLLSSTLTEKNGFPGKIFKWKNDNSNMFFDYHVYLVESVLYQLVVVSNEGENHNVFIAKFFESFEIINIAKGDFRVPVNSTKRSYSIEFPRQPKKETRVIDSEYGRLALDIQMLESKIFEKNIIYISVETKYPEKVVDNSNLDELDAFYNKSIDASIASVNGDFVSAKNIDYDGYPGKEYRSYFSDKSALMVYRIYLIDNNYYQLGVITNPESDNNKDMLKFFDSFRVNK